MLLLLTRVASWLVLAIVCTLAPSIARGAPIEAFTEPNRKMDVAPAEPGIIASLDVKEGDRVTKGQLLATLDCEALVLAQRIAKAAMESRAQLDAATAERELRRHRLERLESLRTRNHASQDEVERARVELEVAEANVLAAEEQRIIDRLEYEKNEALVERRRLRSPVDGVVTRVHREEREYVSSNNPAVLTVVQLDPLRITFCVPTALGLTLKQNQTVPLVFPESGQKADGKVELVSPVTDPESGTIRVKVLVDNAKGLYRCGVRCCLDTGEAPTTAAAAPLRLDLGPPSP